MLESARLTTKHPFEVLLYLDEDDETRGQYPKDVKTIVGPRINLGPAYNVLQKEIAADLYMMGADDLIFLERDWDEAVRRAAHKDLLTVISFDDCSGMPGNPKEHGHPFVGKAFIERQGFLAHPSLGHSCIDNFVVRNARALERFKVLPTRIEHVHPKYYKAGKQHRGEPVVWDKTYLDNDRAAKERDGVIYRNLTK